MGVIGTKGTIGSRAYQRRLEARGLRVWAQACPMLVHVVEEGLVDSRRGRAAGAPIPERASGDRRADSGMHALPAAAPRATAKPWAPASRWWIAPKPTAEVVSSGVWSGAGRGGPGRVVHFVTGDPVAFAHTAKVIGGVEGEIIPLPVTELQPSAISRQPSA